MNRTKLFAGLFALAMIPSAHAGQIAIKGSDTMVILSQKWAETFMKLNPATKISITGGGTGTGIAALINNTTNLANASRQVAPAERAQIQKGGKKLLEIPVAMDALAVVVNGKSAPVKALTMQMLMGIYTGQINDWKEVGGRPGRIVRYCRESNSGTYEYFKEHVLMKKDYAPDCQGLPGTAAVAEAVSKDGRGIGYGGVAYFGKRSDVRVVPISPGPGKQAVSPLQGTKVVFPLIWKRVYPISRFLYMYKAGALTPEEQKFVNYVKSPAGQKIVVDTEYIPLPGK